MRNLWFKILIGWVAGITVLYSTLSILRHVHFQSGGFDLGLYDQAVWQYANFQWPYNTVKERFILGDHLTLTLPVLAPLYWLWSDVRILLVFQAFWLSFSAFAIYKLTQLRKFSPTVSFIVAFIYSLFFGIQYAVFFDFHPVVIGVGLIPWVAYFLETKKKRLLIASVAVLLLTQENMGISLAGLGLIYFFRKSYRRTAIVFIVIGMLAALTSAKAIGWFSPTGFQYWPQISGNPLVFVKSFFDTTEKQQVWFYTLASFTFLPLLSPGAMLAIGLDLAQYFVTGPEFSRMWSPFMHHRALLGPFVALGGLEGLEVIGKKKWNGGVVAVILLMSAIVQQYIFHLPLNKLVKKDYWREESWMKDDRKLIALVPAEGSVATQQNLVPHLSHRSQIYLAYPRPHDYDDNRCGKRSCWWLDFNTHADYLVVDMRTHQWLTQILESNDHFQQAVVNMEKAKKINLITRVGEARLYKINR